MEFTLESTVINIGIFGHTPMIKGAVKRANQEYIDTGAVFGYGLTMRKIK
ncbi:hypothetical protein ABN238_12110 [Providencia rettgeri]